MNARQEVEMANDSRDTLYLLGGVALVLFGAGLILASPLGRQLLGRSSVGNLLQAALPDVERYLRLKAM